MIQSLLFRPTALLALALLAVIAMMILPMPSVLLDIGLAASFGLAVLIFAVVLFVERPLDFSSFPTVLLASLILRLALNVSSTKLIIGEGHTGTDAAGEVIEGFAMFIMGGSVFLGIVIFIVILIVNFMVITKGAARMAEVSARFALDAMPGKQLAIDSDVASGAIDHAEAKARREREQAETTFFGSLDGASKFVKGDAIAGLLITILNLVMGMIMGVGVHGMALGPAFETYAILTVGDALVGQIPAVIISIAAALLLARGGATGAADVAMVGQLGRHPAALATVALLMGVFAVMPGLPFVPFMAGAAGLGYLAWRRTRTLSREAARPAAHAPDTPVREATLGDVLDFDDIHIEFAPDLVALVLDPVTGLESRIRNMRTHIATGFGVILPEIRLTDDSALAPGEYVIRIQGVEQARAHLRTGSLLTLTGGGSAANIPGDDVSEPVYQAPARWIDPALREQAALQGLTVVTPTEVLATHLLEVVKSNFARLLTLKSLRRLLDEFTSLSDARRAEANRRLIDELIPDRVPMDLLLAVLRLLLEERVSIRNLPMILEAIAEVRGQGQTAETICEHVRQRLGFQLVADIRRADGTVPLVQLAPDWETLFSTYQIPSDHGRSDVALPPSEFNRLASALSERLGRAAEAGVFAALVTSPGRRRFLRTVLATRQLQNPVISYAEIGPDVRPSLIGVIPA
jgi:flagellar biosynthesis protein FlhA